MRIIFAILFILVCFNGTSQDLESSKYLSSLLYLKTNQATNNKVKEYFKRELKKTKYLKDDYLTFNLSSEVYFQPISNFEKQIAATKHAVDSIFAKERDEYQKAYDFETYKSELLSELIPANSSPLCLAFSEPVDNYLLAEFFVENQFLTGDITISKKDFKQGVFVHLLFFFKANGSVEDVYIVGFHYN